MLLRCSTIALGIPSSQAIGILQSGMHSALTFELDFLSYIYDILNIDQSEEQQDAQALDMA